MPKLNRCLVTSLMEDIKEFMSVANEMCTWIGKVEHLSWRFPTRSAKNVNAMAMMEQHKGSAGEMYILLLEMAYDRMHFVLRLVVEFMDGYPFIEDFFKEVTTVKRPSSTSMANIVRTLWCRLKLIPETITRNMIKANQVNDHRISRACQTNSGSLSSCESCSSASKFIGSLMGMLSAALEENNLFSVIAAQREVLRADLFEKTQWAIMTKLLDAMDEDMKTLLTTISATLSKSKANAMEYEKSLESLGRELEEHRTEKLNFEMKIREMMDRMNAVNDQLEISKVSQIELVQRTETLTTSLAEAEEKSSNLEILMTTTLGQISKIAASKLALENIVKTTREELTSGQQASTIAAEDLRKSLDLLREEKISVEKQHREELESLKQRHEEIVKKIQEDARPVITCVAETQTEDEGPAVEFPAPKGDPEVDMAQQLAANEKAIEKLERQNERLSRTLNRLKEHRRNSQIN